MARIRIAGTDPSTVPTPPAGKSTLFVDINDLSYKAKLPDGSIIPISVTEEYLQDIIGTMIQDSATIDFTYDDVGNVAFFEVIQSALDVFQIPVTPTGNLTSDNVGDALNELQSSIDTSDQNLADHLADPTDAHDASAISYVNTTSGLTATELQSAVDEVDQNLDDHLNGAPNKHDATEIDYERVNVDKNDIQAGSVEVESALSDLDDNKLSRSGNQPMTGDLDMDGNNIITGVGLVDGRDVSVDGAKLDTIETNAKDDQLASEVPITPTGSLTQTDVQAIITELEEIVSNAQTVTVDKSPGTGQFDSVKGAIDSITDASAVKPYVVEVGPGIFLEDQITMKPFVSIRGSGKLSTIIAANDPAQDLLIGAGSTLIRDVGLTGTSTAALLQFTAANATETAISLTAIGFLDCQTAIDLEAGAFDTTIDMANCTFTNNIVSTNVLQVRAPGAGLATLSMDALRGGFTQNSVHFIDVEGPNCSVVGSDLLFESNGTSHFIHAEDGAVVSLSSVAATNFNFGIHTPNIGVGPQIDFSGILRSVTWDIRIENSDTTGFFIGAADNEKVSIEPTAEFRLNFTDPINGGDIGQIVVGQIRQADRYDRLANITKLLREGTTVGVIEGGVITINSGFDIDVSAGNGFLLDQTDVFIKEVSWNADTLTIPADSVRYIYVDTNGVVQQAASPQSLIFTMPIGRVTTDASGIRTIEDIDMDMVHLGNKVEQFLRNLGPVFKQGGTTSESGTRELNVTAGIYNYGISEINLAGGSPISWTVLYRDGIGGWVEASQSTVDNAQYDDGSGTLASIPSNQYAKHILYAVGTPGIERYFVVYSQDFYADQPSAADAPLPTIPTFIADAVVRVAGVIVREGVSNIIDILDLRPRIGFAAPTSSGSASHSGLLGLLADDHPQYLLIDGTRAMSGNLDMGGNDIINIDTLNGVSIENHGSRHLPGGADALTTDAPDTNLNGNTTNAEGNNNSFARSNHTHAIDNATITVAGFMSASDKSKLDGIEPLAKDDQVASEVPVTPAGNLGSTDVQAALEELQGDIDTQNSNLATHLNGGPSKHDASEIDYERLDGSKVSIQATSDDAESALTDLDDNKLARNGSQPMTGDLDLDGNNILNPGTVDGRDISVDGSKLDTIETNAKDDQDAFEVPFNPATSSLVSTDVQAMGEEVAGRLDTNESDISGLDTDKLNRDGTQPMTGDLNLDGNDIITGLGLVDGRDVSADGAKLDTIETNAKDDQVASEVPLTPTGNISATNVQAGIAELDAEKQPLDGDLTAIANLTGTGIIVRNATNNAVVREIIASSGEVTVTNGDGVSGDPEIGLPNVGTASTVGAANSSLSITTDSKGRVTNKSTQLISILASQVSDFAAAVRSTLLTGFAVGANAAIAATDTVLQAFQKAQGQINERIQGPASATDNAITRYDGTSGKLAQNSSATVDDNGGITAGDFLRPGDTADTTNANIRYNNNELQSRINGVWRNLGIVPTKLSQTGDTSTTSGTPAVIAGMTTTPAAGTYMVIFECSAIIGEDTSGDIGLYVGGSLQTDSVKTLQAFANGGFGPSALIEVPVTIIDFVTVNGAQAIDIRFDENGGGTLTVGPRKLIIVPIAR